MGLAVVAGTLVVPAPGHAVALRPAGLVSRSTTDGLLWEVGPDGRAVMAANGLGVSPGTTPVVAALSTGGRVIAFHASGAAGTDTLWWVDANNAGHNTGIQMWPGTSPAIAANRFGGWQIAFEAATSRLWTLDSVVGQVQTPSAMLNGRGAPSIAALADGTYEIAYLASDASLWVQNSAAGGHRLDVPFAAATGPAIAAGSGGGWKLAIEASTTREWTVDSAGRVVQTLSALAPDTIPAIAGLPQGGYVQAFVASSGILWLEDSDGNGHSTGLPIASGTSPAVAVAATGGWQVALQDNHHDLIVIDSAGRVFDTYQSVSATNSPDLDTALPAGLPFADQAPLCGCAAPTAGLTALANAIQIRAKGVTTVVKVPAGLTVANTTEVSVLFGLNARITQNYNPTTGNVLHYDFPAGDASTRQENVLVNLTEHAPAGAIPFNFSQTVTIAPRYNISRSPLTFTLTSECDYTLWAFPEDSEVEIHWNVAYNQGRQANFDDMRAGDVRHVPEFAFTGTNVGLADGIADSPVWFGETDPPPPISGPADFYSHPINVLPILPAVSHHVHEEDFSKDGPPDRFCHGNFDYDLTINLITFAIL